MPGLPASVSASKGWIFPAGSVRAIDSIVALAGFARCPLRVRKVLRKPNSTKSDLCFPISNLSELRGSLSALSEIRLIGSYDRVKREVR